MHTSKLHARPEACMWQAVTAMPVPCEEAQRAFLVCTISLASIFADRMSPRLAASLTCFSASFLSRSMSRICRSSALCCARMSACHFLTSS